MKKKQSSKPKFTAEILSDGDIRPLSQRSRKSAKPRDKSLKRNQSVTTTKGKNKQSKKDKLESSQLNKTARSKSSKKVSKKVKVTYRRSSEEEEIILDRLSKPVDHSLTKKRLER